MKNFNLMKGSIERYGRLSNSGILKVKGQLLALLRMEMAFYFSEVNDYAIKVYQQRFPDAIGLGDIRKIKGGWINERGHG